MDVVFPVKIKINRLLVKGAETYFCNNLFKYDFVI